MPLQPSRWTERQALRIFFGRYLDTLSKAEFRIKGDQTTWRVQHQQHLPPPLHLISTRLTPPLSSPSRQLPLDSQTSAPSCLPQFYLPLLFTMLALWPFYPLSVQPSMPFYRHFASFRAMQAISRARSARSSLPGLSASRSLVSNDYVQLITGPNSVYSTGCFPFLTHYPEIALDRWAKKFGPLYSMWLGDQLFVVVSDPQMVKDLVVTNGAVFSSRKEMFMKSQIIFARRGITATPYNDNWYVHGALTLNMTALISRNIHE